MSPEVSAASDLVDDLWICSCLTELQLPAALDAVQQPLGVPPALLTKAAAVKSEGGVARLEAMMKDVRRVAEVNRKLVQEVRQPSKDASTPPN